MYINVGTIMTIVGLLFLAGSIYGRIFLNEPALLVAAMPALFLVFGPLVNAYERDAHYSNPPESEAREEVAERKQEGRAVQLKSRYELSDREEEIMLLLARGFSRNAIGEKLYLSRNTVDTHIRSLYLKLGCHKKDEIIRLLEESSG